MQLVLLNWPSLTNGLDGHLAAARRCGRRASRTGRSTTRSLALLALSRADVVADPADEVRHGPDRDARGRGQGRDGRRHRRRRTRSSASSRAPCSSAMAGGVYAYYLTFIDPRGMFDIVISVQIVLSMLLGGRGTLWGPVLGAFIIEPLNELANQSLGGGNSRLLIFGGLMALVVLFLPQGIVPFVARAARARAAGAARHAIVGARLESPLVMREREAAPVGHDVQAGRAAARGQGPREALRRPAGGRRLLVRRARGLDHRADRAERVGQDDGVQPDRRHDARRTRARSGSTGSAIDRLRPWRRAHLGLGRTFQITRLFREMTVLENVVAPLRDVLAGASSTPARSAARRPSAPRSCSSSSAWAASATSRRARCPTASRSSSSSRRCSCSTRS